MGETHRLQDLLDARLVSGDSGRRALRIPALAVQRQFQIVPDGMAFEHRRLLELAADAELRNLGLVLLRKVDLAAVEEDVAVSGRVLPVMMSIIVVLPAPFGPMMALSSPGSTMKESEFSALKPSKETDTPLR